MGYGQVLRNGVFMAFVGVLSVMLLVYMQMNTTLSVYLRDAHGISAQGAAVVMPKA